MPEYTLYVDVWLLRLGCNFAFEYLLLWATATITHTKTRPARLFLGSLVGTFYYFLYLLASLGLLPYYGFLRFLPIVVLVSLVMVFVTFYPIGWKSLFKVAGHFYGIGFIAAGMGMAAAYLLGPAGSPQFTVGTIVSVLAILLIAEIGWGVVHETLANRVYRIPLEILCDEMEVQTTALVDTGNHLKDPLNRQPVIIVDKSALLGLLPPELTEIILDLGDGKLEAIDQLGAITKWQTRLRLIPYSSIGKNNGLLIGFRPDAVKIGGNSLPAHLQPTIAVHPYRLSPDDDYMALLPPILLEGSAENRKGGDAYAQTNSTDI
jgi:stage II sporulation protein GA (sporulation sigma-E factor processing peptidase)